MAQARKRGGAKQHRQRVILRNKKLETLRKKYQQMLEEQKEKLVESN